jgi:Flp pilus assembly pilin Flp
VRPRDQAGQTTAEYAALLALVAAALAGAGAVAGPGELAAAVVSGLRTGICIAAGDVCRASDAAAAGLSPCVVRDHARGEGLTFTVVSLRLGADDGWSAAARSDGSVVVTHTSGRTVGGEVGIGVEASPLGVGMGAAGKLDYRFDSGRAWEFSDAAGAVRFLESGDREGVEPTWRFGDAGTLLRGEAKLDVAGLEVAGVESSAGAAAGVRTGRGLTTYYVRARVDAFDASASVPGARVELDGPPAADAIVELTRDAGGRRELAVRTVERGARAGQVVETVARLDLRDPANHAAAEPLLSMRLPWPPTAARELRMLVRRMARTGIVERSVYDVRDDSQEVALSARLGLALGLTAEEVDVDRRLVAASAWTRGSRARDRADCGVTGAGFERTS